VLQLLQEVVPLRKVCRRPETEQRLLLAREVSKLSNKDTAVDRPLNGTPNLNAPQIPPTTPATPTTVTQLGSAFNATHLSGTSPSLYTPVQQGTSTPGLQPMQPIPMQSLATPDAVTSIHQQAALQGATPVHAISSSQGPAPSLPIAATQSTIVQQATTSVPPQQSIETSISRQLTISAPVEQQSHPNIAGVEPSVTGDGQQQFTAVAAVSGQHDTTSGDAKTSNLSQPMDIVSSTPAVDPIGPVAAAQATTAAEVVLPPGSNVATAPPEVQKPLLSKDLPDDEPTKLGEATILL